MRIVTRPDFDGIVCAALLHEAMDIAGPVKWVEPSEIGNTEIREGDIIANLPYHPNCSLWFDHHYTNRIDTPFEGEFRETPSAARIIYEYYRDRFKRDYGELLRMTDKIDSADLTLDEVLHPENYPCILLSMTVKQRNGGTPQYWGQLVDLLGKYDSDRIIEQADIRERKRLFVERNRQFKTALQNNTTMSGVVSVTDFRGIPAVSDGGNRFLVYVLFPESVVNIKIRYLDPAARSILVNVGHSIFNRGCNVNVGAMLSKFGGGGHRGAGSAIFEATKTEYLGTIINILMKNETPG